MYICRDDEADADDDGYVVAEFTVMCRGRPITLCNARGSGVGLPKFVAKGNPGENLIFGRSEKITHTLHT